MGYQSYVIPFDTDEQLDTVLDVIKLHNATPGGYTGEFVRYSEDSEFIRLEVGEELQGTTVVTFKTGKAYSCPRKGPALTRAVLVSNGGGRSVTFPFLKWHLRRALPNVYVGGFHAVDVYGYDHGMANRFSKKNVFVESARITDEKGFTGLSSLVSGEVADEFRGLNGSCYAPRPAKYTTRTSGNNPHHEVALLGLTGVERKKRSREVERDEPPFVSSYSTAIDGWVVQDVHFETEEKAKAWAKREMLRPAFNKLDVLDHMQEMRDAEETRNHARFVSMRAGGKSYWTAGWDTRFWLTDEEVAERRAEGKTLEPATIDYEEKGQAYGTAWKKASIADIEAMLAACKSIILHNC